MPGDDERGRLREVARVFLTLGTIAFGGPVAHIAMMRRELVGRRQWMSRTAGLWTWRPLAL